MAEPEVIEQLDRAVEQMLAGAAVSPGSEIEALLEMAAIVRQAPSEEFRRALKTELMDKRRENHMHTSTTESYVPEGKQTVNPYPVVTDGEAFLEFLTNVLGGERRLRADTPEGRVMHCEVLVGDTLIEFGEGNDRYPPAPMAFHLYVENADAVYQRAIDAGAESLHPMTDQPYGDREGSVRDRCGNHWYIATHQGAGHKPAGLRSVTPYLHARGADGLIEFMKQGFGAQEIEVHRGDDGTVAHAKMRIGDSVVELGEAHGQWGPMTGNLHVYVPDTDAAYQRALAAGATSQRAPVDQPYGDRVAGVVDAWGNQWWPATPMRGA